MYLQTLLTVILKALTISHKKPNYFMKVIPRFWECLLDEGTFTLYSIYVLKYKNKKMLGASSNFERLEDIMLVNATKMCIFNMPIVFDNQ
jgi:hypothetical protein